MKILMLIFLFSPFAFSKNDYSIALENDNLLIIIDAQCSPCDISCNKLKYRLFDKNSAMKSNGVVESINSGGTHDFRGYFIKNKDSTFSLYETEGSAWQLIEETKKSAEIKSEMETIYSDKQC